MASEISPMPRDDCKGKAREYWLLTQLVAGRCWFKAIFKNNVNNWVKGQLVWFDQRKFGIKVEKETWVVERADVMYVYSSENDVA